ncbi:antibiotic biosynthesis monooxygenase family protein [Lysobacter sp. A286]
MFIAAFIWEPGVYDEEFHRLNAMVEELAQSMPGYLGVESWQSADGKRKNATYYWDSLDTLKAFSEHPTHQEAKRNYSRWYAGYHIVISEVIRSYGDSAFSHLTPNERRKHD